ncbi:MAG: fibronectin type III domain-containing protein, partial [Elusimicrobiota bacterium]
MKTTALVFLSLLSLAACGQRAEAMEKMSGGSMAVARSANNSGGEVSAGGAFSLNASVGETAFSSAAAGSFSVTPGYTGLAAQPGSVVSITAATKSTGTLDLSWLAPGADGFLGAVTNGVYRLDYSSDAAHIFAPTTFLQELSTSVAAGDPQQLSISGLQPNTTYYTKIYLGDAGKVMAEDSTLSAESTLSDLPVNPGISAISACKVTISWVLPGSGAAGYRTEGSTTSFGVLSPGGDIKTASTPNGLQVSLTINNLVP